MKKIVLFLVASSSVSFGWAQLKAPVTKLSFKEAVKIGLQNNVTLQQQKNQLDYTQVNKVASLLQLGPSVQAQGSLYRNDGNSFNQNKGEVINGVVDYMNGSISASVPVFNGFKILNQYKQANNANEAQLHMVHRSQQDVIRDVSSQYLLCLLDQQLIKIDEENVQTQTTQYGQIKAQSELGSKAEADMVNQEYQMKNAELLLVRSRNKLKNDLATLALTLQVDPNFEVEDVEWDVNNMVADSLELDQMYTTAIDRRADLKQAVYAEKAARFGYSALKGNYYPSLYAGASYGSRYNYIHGEDNRTFHDQFTQDNTMKSYGFNLTIPIYNGFLYRSQAAFQKVNYENAKVRHRNAEVTVKTDVLRSYQNFRDAKTNYAAAESQLRAAKLSYQMEKERYDLGVSNIVQFTTANQSYVKAQGDFQNARYTLMFQRLLISHAMGTLKEEDIP